MVGENQPYLTWYMALVNTVLVRQMFAVAMQAGGGVRAVAMKALRPIMLCSPNLASMSCGLRNDS